MMNEEEMRQELHKIEVQRLVDTIISLIAATRGILLNGDMLRTYSGYVENGDVWERVAAGASLEWLKSILISENPNKYLIDMELEKIQHGTVEV